jgi:hypothetical protein
MPERLRSVSGIQFVAGILDSRQKHAGMVLSANHVRRVTYTSGGSDQ